MAAQQVAAEEWRGIVPLRSTRPDVVRVFNQCSVAEPYCGFTLENEEILIIFSTLESCNGVPPDTVLSIQRELQNAIPFTALTLDKRRFKAFDPAIPRNMGYRGFIDEKSGLLFKTFLGEVFQFNYIAAKKDWPVCFAYYRNPREFVEVIRPHFQMISSVGCPQTAPIAGEKVVIRADYPRTGQRLLLTWETTDGRILEGQGTGEIVLDTTGLEGKIITVTVELNDGNQHTANAACTFKVSPKTSN